MGYLIRVIHEFTDRETGNAVKVGSLFETDGYERVRNIVRLRLGEFAGVKHPERKGNRIMIHQKYCYKIGGIETANMSIAKAFQDRNIVFVFGSGDTDQIMALGKYHDVIIDDGHQTYDVDVCIFTNYDSAPAIMDRVHARKIYQQIHADFYALKQMPQWRNFTWKPNPRTSAILSVSETAQKGLQRAFQLDSIVVPNILSKRDSRPTVFMSLTRATPEKGVDKLVALLRHFDEANKDYVLFLCSSIEQGEDSDQLYLRENPRVVTVQPTPYAQELLRAADYLIQLSYNESYCYSVREALQLGVPCIVSDIPELRKLIQNGKNGYIYHDGDDIEPFFKRLTPKPREEEISPLWEKVLDGRL